MLPASLHRITKWSFKPALGRAPWKFIRNPELDIQTRNFVNLLKREICCGDSSDSNRKIKDNHNVSGSQKNASQFNIYMDNADDTETGEILFTKM